MITPPGLPGLLDGNASGMWKPRVGPGLMDDNPSWVTGVIGWQCLRHVEALGGTGVIGWKPLRGYRGYWMARPPACGSPGWHRGYWMITPPGLPGLLDGNPSGVIGWQCLRHWLLFVNIIWVAETLYEVVINDSGSLHEGIADC